MNGRGSIECLTFKGCVEFCFVSINSVQFLYTVFLRFSSFSKLSVRSDTASAKPAAFIAREVRSINVYPLLDVFSDALEPLSMSKY